MSRVPPAPAPRAATAADRPALEALLAGVDLPTAGVGEILAHEPDDFLVVDDPATPGRLAAAAGLEVCGAAGEERVALLRSVAVRPAWRGRGLAGALVRGVVAAAEARGLAALYLLTTTAEALGVDGPVGDVAATAPPAPAAGSAARTARRSPA